MLNEHSCRYHPYSHSELSLVIFRYEIGTGYTNKQNIYILYMHWAREQQFIILLILIYDLFGARKQTALTVKLYIGQRHSEFGVPISFTTSTLFLATISITLTILQSKSYELSFYYHSYQIFEIRKHCAWKIVILWRFGPHFHGILVSIIKKMPNKIKGYLIRTRSLKFEDIGKFLK